MKGGYIASLVALDPFRVMFLFHPHASRPLLPDHARNSHFWLCKFSENRWKNWHRYTRREANHPLGRLKHQKRKEGEVGYVQASKNSSGNPLAPYYNKGKGQNFVVTNLALPEQSQRTPRPTGNQRPNRARDDRPWANFQCTNAALYKQLKQKGLLEPRPYRPV